MATSNSPGVSDPSQDTGGFFSRFTELLNQGQGILRGVGDTAKAVVPLWDQRNPDPSANNNAPTFAGASDTTGTITGQTTNYIPWIIGGGVVLVAIIFFATKK